MTFVYRIGHLGDSIVAIPAVAALAAAFPGDRLVLVTNAPRRQHMVTAWDVLQHTGLFHDVIFYRPTPGSVFDLARRLRNDAHGSQLYYLTPARTAFQRRRDAWFFRHACGFTRIFGLDRAIERPTRDAQGSLVHRDHEYRRLFHDVCGELGIERSLPAPPLLTLPDAAIHKAHELLAPLGSRRLVSIGVGTKMQSKKWFLDRYVHVARRILEHDPECALVLMGGSEDHADGETIAGEVGRSRVANLAGATSVIESAAVLARCALFVGNDTGTMHLAAAMGTRCVAIFSARDSPGLWEPYGDGHRVIRRDVPCAGCHLEECHEHGRLCLERISVEDVWTHVRDVLEEGRG